MLGTYTVVAALIVLLAAFVYGWLTEGRRIPEVVFSGLLGLIGTLVGYVWHRSGGGQRKEGGDR
jgi:NhaP-type Na+/H+ or K+/H+ antiporter